MNDHPEDLHPAFCSTRMHQISIVVPWKLQSLHEIDEVVSQAGTQLFVNRLSLPVEPADRALPDSASGDDRSDEDTSYADCFKLCYHAHQSLDQVQWFGCCVNVIPTKT